MTAQKRWGLRLAVGLIAFAIFWQSYNGRQDVVNNNRAGCERGIKDRVANRDSWYAAYQARLYDAEHGDPATRKSSLAAARIYWNTAWSLNSRVDRAHTLTVHGRHPLGYGRLDCNRANPKASPVQFFG